MTNKRKPCVKASPLAISGEKYQKLFEASRDALMILDASSWRFIQANKEALRLFGATNRSVFVQFAPWTLSPKYQPDGRLSSEKAKEMLRAAAKKGRNLFEWTHNRLDGTVFYAEVLLTYIKTRSRPLILASVRDITVRKRTETALFESESLLNAIFDSTPDFVFLKDPQGRYVKVNRSALRLMGRKEEEVIGKTDAELFGPFVAEMNEKEDLQVMRSGKSMGFVKEMRFPSGTFHMNVIKTPFGRAGEPGLLGVGRDVSKIKEMERDLALSNARDTVDRIARPLAHDFSNVLAIINGYATLLKELPLSRLGHKEATKILEAVERASRITEQLRAFAAALDGHRESEPRDGGADRNGRR